MCCHFTPPPYLCSNPQNEAFVLLEKVYDVYLEAHEIEPLIRDFTLERQQLRNEYVYRISYLIEYPEFKKSKTFFKYVSPKSFFTFCEEGKYYLGSSFGRLYSIYSYRVYVRYYRRSYLLRRRKHFKEDYIETKNGFFLKGNRWTFSVDIEGRDISEILDKVKTNAEDMRRYSAPVTRAQM